MNIIQCSICKKPFQSIGSKVCNECLAKMDEDFIVVRDYIYENKKADMDKVSEETGVSKQVIMYLLKEGRLIIEDLSDSGGLLLCEMCRKPIRTGRMCDHCKDSLASTMKKSVTTGRPSGSGSSGSSGRKETDNFKGSAKIK